MHDCACEFGMSLHGDYLAGNEEALVWTDGCGSQEGRGCVCIWVDGECKDLVSVHLLEFLRSNQSVWQPSRVKPR